MLRATIDEARPGMRLAMPIFHPRTSSRLLAEGYTLDAKTIARLKELDVYDVWVMYPHTELIREAVSPTILKEQNKLAGRIGDLFDELHADTQATVDFAPYKDAIEEMIESLLNEPQAATYINDIGGRSDSDFRHASAVSMLSLLIGLNLQGYLINQRPRLNAKQAQKVAGLGFGAMLHDVGLLQVPPEVIERFRRTGDEGDPEWRAHAELGYRMVTGSVDPAAAGVVLQHHQYFDGTGFPTRDFGAGDERPLRGEEIHIFARIACVADHFDRLCNPHRGGRMLRVEALRRMIEPPLASRFDPVVLQALLTAVPAYPPGSTVTLNDARQAIVIEVHPDAPCRPTVQLMEAPEEPAGGDAPPRFDLRDDASLWIAKHRGADVASLNFDRPKRGLAEAA